MYSNSCSASDGRFDSATSLIPPLQCSGCNPSTAPSSPVDNEVTKPVVPYSALKSSRPTKTGSYISPRSPGASKSIYSRLYRSRYRNTVVPSPGSSFDGPPQLSSEDTSSSASSDTLTSGTTNRLSCEVCGTTFTGIYGRGNRGRHMRQYHTQAATTSIRCLVEGCTRSFARQDARLKHQRTHHSELHLNSNASLVNLSEVPVSVSAAFCNIRAKLDDKTYAQFCDMFLYLFPRLVQYLRDTGSNTYGVYMEVLKETLVAVDATESKSTDSIDQPMAGPALLSRPRCRGTASSSKGKGSVVNLGPSSMSRTDPSHPSRGRKLTHGRKNGSHKVAKSHPNENPPSRWVDCPDHKYHKMNSNSPPWPCNGLQAQYMSQVLYHLRRTNHQGRPGTWMCPFCKKYFNRGRSMDAHIEASNCQTRVQPRGDIVKPWAMLFLTRHPDATYIPSPYCGDNEPLPDSIWEECRASLQDNSAPIEDNPVPIQDGITFLPDTSVPFLGRSENTMRYQGHETMHGSNNLSVEAYLAAVNFTIWMLNSTAPSVFNISSATLASSSTAGFNGDHQPDQNSLTNFVAIPHSTLFRTAAQHWESLACSLELQEQEAWHVETGQISPIANAAEMVVNNTRRHDHSQQPLVQDQGQDDSNSSANLPTELLFSTIETSDLRPEWQEPIQNGSFPTQHNAEYSTVTLSTCSSQTDVPTGTYLTQPSSVTNVSSIYGATDRMLPSATNSPYYRRGSEKSDAPDYPIPPYMQLDDDGLFGTSSQFEDPRTIVPDGNGLFRTYPQSEYPQTIVPETPESNGFEEFFDYQAD